MVYTDLFKVDDSIVSQVICHLWQSCYSAVTNGMTLTSRVNHQEPMLLYFKHGSERRLAGVIVKRIKHRLGMFSS